MEKQLFPELLSISPDVFENSLAERMKVDQKAAYYARENDRLLKEYNRVLRDQDYVLSRSRLKDLNMIDIRPLLLLGSNTTELRMNFFRKDIEKDIEFARNHDFYSMIPCFSEGAIWCNTDRYIYFKLLDIDAENKQYTIELRDYIGYKYCWTYGAGGTVRLGALDNIYNGVASQTGKSNYQTMSGVYRLLSQNDLGWTNEQIDMWNKSVLALADRTDRYMEKKYHSNQFAELVKVFLLIMVKINRKLEECRPSRPVGEKNNHKGKVKTTVGEELSKKRIRMVGNMPVKSEKPPKLSVHETVVHYTTPSWTTRGYIRTYKSGKQVYIRETVHKRRCMQNMDDEAASTVIRFRKEKP